MKSPSFWHKKYSLPALLLWPLSLLYGAGHLIHQRLGRPYKAELPVICIGNLVAGGSGKTPVVLALAKRLRGAQIADHPYILSRGYKGTLKGPVLVDSDRHSASEVGDEPLFMARKDVAPVIISKNRRTGAALASRQNADIILMDDGLQNRSLAHTLRLVVIDGQSGFGNHLMIPAGPLRTPLRRGLRQADGFIIIGPDRHNLERRFLAATSKPVFHATLDVPNTWVADKQARYIAFSGIGRPEKFKATIEDCGLTLAAWHPFPDHHHYSPQELQVLVNEAATKQARLITTEKDATRLPAAFKDTHKIDIMPIEISWLAEDEQHLMEFIRTHSNGIKKTGQDAP